MVLAETSEQVHDGEVTVDVQWSELQRDPKGVAALAEKGEVRVRRRDGATLLLVREDRAISGSEGAVTAARALRNILAHLPLHAAAEALRDEFSWLDLLPEADRSLFVTEFIRAFQASAELGEWFNLDQMITEWKSTAAAHSDRRLAELLSEPIDEDLGPVPDPDEAA